MLVAANCKYPNEMYGKALKGMASSDFHCSKCRFRTRCKHRVLEFEL